ncbi:MAG: hypothetical protein HY544_03160 [Candidatus Diapherotrites archaeon]|uniref:Uncharacterized protein n=1 Tax=Candidatus Iainarchaeum sp. TaxID=3101447 RepID=A0A8T3YLG0_9ARCH|nr:hypothetical protein [Candidatus Diapherotrites archaeon]
MKAVFQITTLENDWRPPFRKTKETLEFEVSDGDEFDRIVGNGNDEAVFQLLQAMGDRAKLRYSRLFTLKEPMELGGREKTVVLPKGTEATLTYLWGEKGITKKIAYTGITSGKPETDSEEEEEDEDEDSEDEDTEEEPSETGQEEAPGEGTEDSPEPGPDEPQDK